MRIFARVKFQENDMLDWFWQCPNNIFGGLSDD